MILRSSGKVSLYRVVRFLITLWQYCHRVWGASATEALCLPQRGDLRPQPVRFQAPDGDGFEQVRNFRVQAVALLPEGFDLGPHLGQSLHHSLLGRSCRISDTSPEIVLTCPSLRVLSDS